MTPEREAKARNIGLLILRVGVGLMMAFSHGLGKVQKFMAGGPYNWADPIGIGAGPSLFLAGGAEFFCSLALTVGFLTRLVSIPLAFTMAVAAGIVHASDPFKKQEFTLLYLIAYITLFFVGPGRYSIDAWLKRR
ncbi:MAG: DoxX family protein [Elusimicrobia bacterium]|nr:MAG: DoxX family protein [Elusimicrobiota bacterium]